MSLLSKLKDSWLVSVIVIKINYDRMSPLIVNIVRQIVNNKNQFQIEKISSDFPFPFQMFHLSCCPGLGASNKVVVCMYSYVTRYSSHTFSLSIYTC